MDNYFKKGFFFGAGVLTVLLIPTTIYLARGFYLDKKLSACVREANDYKDMMIEKKKIDSDPDAFGRWVDMVVEQTDNMLKICRYKYIRKLTINDLYPNNKP